MKKLNKKNPLYIEDLNNILSIKQYLSLIHISEPTRQYS